MKPEPEELVPNSSPIEEHLAALATSRRLPEVGVAACIARLAEAAPTLRTMLVRASSGEDFGDADWRLFIRGLYILGAGRDRQSFALLLRLLRRAGEEVERLLGDVITEELSKIAAGMYDDDADALFAAIIDSGAGEFVRDALFGAATYLTWDGRIERDRMHLFLRRFYEERLAEPEDYGWIGWLEGIALLGFRDLVPSVDRAFSEGLIPAFTLERDDFVADLAQAEREPGAIDRFEDSNLGCLNDALEAMRWLDQAEGDAEPPAVAEMIKVGAPAVNPMRHVGRNDPCPCGSGTKAKRCCLAR